MKNKEKMYQILKPSDERESFVAKFSKIEVKNENL